MFTGIIESLGVVKKLHKSTKFILIGISPEQDILIDVKLGDSIATNGVCLTVIKVERNYFEADIMIETMNVTALSTLSIGDNVNLERALRLSDRLGGHLVSGHVDGLGTIQTIEKNDITYVFTISTNIEVLRYIILRGSITIDGISLTVMGLSDKNFQVSIIPHTAQQTTLLKKGIGDVINIETDIIAKYIERLLGHQNMSKNIITEDFLKNNGFY